MERRARTGLAQDRRHVLLDEVRLPFLDHQDRALVATEAKQLAVDQRIGDVEHVHRNLRAAVDVGQAEPLEDA